MKKILYIEANKDGTIGGSYYSLLYLIQGLDKTKYEPHVMFCQDNVMLPEFRKVTPYVYINDFGPSASEPGRGLYDFIRWPYWLMADVLLKQPLIRSIINNLKPDLVHINNGYNCLHDWMLACHLSKVKVIAHDRGTRYPCSFRTKYFVRFLDAIISVSDSYRGNVIKQNLKVKRVHRVYNGLDVDNMIKDINLTDIDVFRREFNSDENQPLVGIVGNIDRWKGQLVVLKAIKEVKQIYPDIKCLIVGAICKGAESYKRELDQYIDDNGIHENIHFTGFRKDINRILSILDVLIHASIEPEPFGRTILEGMAAGKAIIGTNAGGTPEQIIHGETGLMVSPGDPHEMAEAIKFILVNPEQSKIMGENARNRLAEKFSIKKMVEETESIYNGIFLNDPIPLNQHANS